MLGFGYPLGVFGLGILELLLEAVSIHLVVVQVCGGLVQLLAELVEGLVLSGVKALFEGVDGRL